MPRTAVAINASSAPPQADLPFEIAGDFRQALAHYNLQLASHTKALCSGETQNRHCRARQYDLASRGSQAARKTWPHTEPAKYGSHSFSNRSTNCSAGTPPCVLSHPFLTGGLQLKNEITRRECDGGSKCDLEISDAIAVDFASDDGLTAAQPMKADCAKLGNCTRL